MLTATLGAMALMAVAHPNAGCDTLHLGRSFDDGRLLATPSPIPVNGVYSVRADAYNNREWISRGITRDFDPAWHWGAPGPAHYGAGEHDFSRVYISQGSAMIVVSPWVSLSTNGLKNADHARVQWLREWGYVGGVRTFRNHRAPASADQQTSVPVDMNQLRPGIDFHPRATIRVPANLRRERPRFQVVRPVEQIQPVVQVETAKIDGL